MKLSTLFVLSSILIAAIYAQEKVVVGYYVPWGKVEPEQLSLDKVTHINYGFGILYKKDDPTSIFIDRYYDGNRIRSLKQLAAAKGVKVLISIGGWTGSQTFSTVAASEDLRKAFINNVLVFVRKNTKEEWDSNPDGWDLDGIDIDWEYPGRQAAICNVVSPQDSANYLILIKELRAALDAEFPNDHKLLTAAVRVKPFDGPDGKPMTDVSAYALYFDYINIMAYDIMGSWSSTTGPNAPFNYDPVKGDPYSFTQGINDWLAAGFPASKLTAGLAFYGRSLTATINMDLDGNNQYVSKDPVTPKGDESDANDPNFFCNEGTVYSGVYKYKFIRSDALTGGPYTSGNGYNRYWDNITQTPWLFNVQTKRYISYDDPQSIKIKVDFAKSKGLRGLMYWDMSQDLNDELLNVVQGIRDGSQPSIPPPSTSSVILTATASNPVSTIPASTTSLSITSVLPSTSTSKSIITVIPPSSTYSSSAPTSTGTCSNGAWQCISVGKSPSYQVCDNGKWLPGSCGLGTVCKPAGSSIICDWP